MVSRGRGAIYLFWPLLLLAVLGSGKWIAPAFVAAVGLASFTASELFMDRDPAGVFFLLPFRAGEFAIGALLVWLPVYPKRSSFMTEMSFLGGVAMIAAAVVTYGATTRFPAAAAMLPCLGAALCIHSGRSTFASLLLGNSVAVAVGAISYSLYLVHWPIIVFLKYLLMRELSALESAGALAACFLTATAMYAVIEQPFRHRRRTRFTVPSSSALGAALFCCVLITTAGWTARADGWAWRLGPQRELAANKKFHGTYYGGVGCSSSRCETVPGGISRVYVIGDSHARALFAGLAKEFPKTNFVMFAVDACTFFSPKTYARHRKYGEQCEDVRPRAFKEIEASGDPVIIAQNWGTYHYMPHVSDDDLEPQRSFASIGEHLPYVVAELKDLRSKLSPRRFLVIGGVPGFNEAISPLDCIGRPFQELACGFSPLTAKAVAANASINKHLVEGGLAFVDPYSFMCGDRHCRNFTDNGYPIYSDTSHLSEWGSAFFVTPSANITFKSPSAVSTYICA